MQITSSARSPFRGAGLIVGSALMVIGVLCIGLYGFLWWSEARRPAPVVPSPPLMALGDM